MLKRWLIYSVLVLLIGINAQLLYDGLAATVFLLFMAVLSLIFIVFGAMKKDRFA